ncbi:hypothetical protein [Brevundimonas nasdae]|uniref:hypothetical protein n=1 Tax=Brevundimonas nasdae TaxID=172043 RepID=UPI003019619E
MNNTTIRIGLAAVAAFYVIVTSLFLQAYIPVQRFNAQAEASSQPDTPKAVDQHVRDALSYTDNLEKVSQYGSVLTWGTVGIVTFGVVFIVTRQRKRTDTTLTAKGDAQ